MTGKKVSFLVAVYNGAPFVEECIDSCLNQTYPEVEVCVTDDGSQDQTLEILTRRYGADPRVIIDSFPENRGKVAAYNRCFARASGEFLLVFGADDVNFPDRLERSLEQIQGTACDLLIGGFDIVDEGLNRVGMYRPEVLHGARLKSRLIENNIVSGGGLLFNRNIARDVFPIPASLLFEDWWIVFNAVFSEKEREICFIDRSLFQYRQHGGNTVGMDKGKIRADYRRHFAYYALFRERLQALGDNENLRRVDRVEAFKSVLVQESLWRRLPGLAASFARLDKFTLKGLLAFFLGEDYDLPQRWLWRARRRGKRRKRSRKN